MSCYHASNINPKATRTCYGKVLEPREGLHTRTCFSSHGVRSCPSTRAGSFRSHPILKMGFETAAHKDRLLRFGSELVFSVCEAKNVEVVILNKGENSSFEEDLAKDVLEIITVFSARLYGSRSHKNKKLIDGLRKAAEEKGKE